MMVGLPEWLPVTQVVANITTTVAGLCVSVAALVFGYRNNFGWKPILLITGHGMGSGSSKELYDIMIRFEIWNRRKLPVVIRSMAVAFKEIEIAPAVSTRMEVDEGWIFAGGNEVVWHSDPIVLPASEHRRFQVAVPMKVRALDDLSDNVRVSFSYYDPRTNKTKMTTIHYAWTLKMPDSRSQSRLSTLNPAEWLRRLR